MTDSTREYQGHCLCNAVTFSTRNMVSHMGACHCKTCRGWGGGPYLSVNCGADVTFSGEQHIGVYNSSDWAERGFCKECGSHLFYRLKHDQTHMLPLGLFTSLPEDMRMAYQVFIDQKPGYYDFANDTRNMTAADVMALFAGK